MKDTFDLEKIIQNVSKVKLPGGVVGKTCMVLIVIALSETCLSGFPKSA